MPEGGEGRHGNSVQVDCIHKSKNLTSDFDSRFALIVGRLIQRGFHASECRWSDLKPAEHGNDHERHVGQSLPGPGPPFNHPPHTHTSPFSYPPTHPHAHIELGARAPQGSPLGAPARNPMGLEKAVCMWRPRPPFLHKRSWWACWGPSPWLVGAWGPWWEGGSSLDGRALVGARGPFPCWAHGDLPDERGVGGYVRSLLGGREGPSDERAREPP